MRLIHILRYLTGNKYAIDAMARDKSAIWYGLFFVFIAGVAREYDQESLLYRPDLFLAPLLASAPLALLFYGYLKLKHLPTGGPNGLRSFLGLFWMTAPLALLYALPVEYLCDPLTALKLNTALLAIVATWRVVLFARVISLTLKQPFWQILVEILWGGSIFVVIASFLFSFSLTDIMGGTVHSQETAFKAKVAEVTMITAFWLGLVLFFVQFIKGQERHHFPAQDHASPRRLAVPITLVLAAIAVLALRQPALFRSAKLDQLIRSPDSTADGLDFMAQHEKQDFARTWPLPPAARSEPLRLGRTQRMLENLEPEHPAWIANEIVDYIDTYFSSEKGKRSHHGHDLILILAKLPDTVYVNDMLQRHPDLLKESYARALTNLNGERWPLINAVEKRLDRLDIEISREDSIIQLFHDRYEGFPSLLSYQARDAMNLISALPGTPSADQWLGEHQDKLLDALNTARTEFHEQYFSAAANRLAQAGIAVPANNPATP